MAANKDAKLKSAVKQIIESCRLDDVIIDREVQFNLSGTRDSNGRLIPEKEVDVVVRFTSRGEKILLLFECEDTEKAREVRKTYGQHNTDVDHFKKDPQSVSVLGSSDQRIKARHLVDIDDIRSCFVYGSRLLDSSYQHCLNEAKRHKFTVWNSQALTYYQKISAILGKLTKYELFKDFSLFLESQGTYILDAIEIKQKGRRMYLAKIHPGQLLKIAYVVRRAYERTYAYQRLLSKQRIEALGEFISSTRPESFLPSNVIAVLDGDVRSQCVFDPKNKKLTIPLVYCSAWIIDGQHRIYGFVGTPYEDWTPDKFKPFDLPIVLFDELPLPVQTETFITINYNQKKIKSELLCDLSTLTQDLNHRLSWASRLGSELSRRERSPLKDKIKSSELHGGRPISLASFVQYGLLETLLGYKNRTGLYDGPLFHYASFNTASPFTSHRNQQAFRNQISLMERFLLAVQKNTSTGDAHTDPWTNWRDYQLIRPTGINALFMVLAKILEKYPGAGLDLERFLKPLRKASFRSQYVVKMGGGWKGFRGLANAIIRKLNKGKKPQNRLALYGQKEK